MHRLVIALVTLLGLTGAAVVAAYLLLFAAGTDRAARLAPADTALYVNVYLQPSAGQQMNLSELIGRFPGFADEASLDDKVDQVVQNLLAGTGIDYRAQLKPWLGNQVALAAGASLDDPAAGMVVIAEVKDRAAAESAIAALVSNGVTPATRTHQGVEIRVTDQAAYAFVDEMLVVAEAPGAVERVIDVSRGAEALASRADFRDTMAAMPADHLAVTFVDLSALARATDAEAQFAELSTAGAVLVAERDGLVLRGTAPLAVEAAGTGSPAEGPASEASSLVEWMPSNTVAELVLVGLRQTLEDAEAAAAGTPAGEDLTGALDTLRAILAFGLGIDLDADLLPLLDREVALAITGFDGDLPSGQLLLRPDDPAAAEATLGELADGLAAVGGEVRSETLNGATMTVVGLPDVGEVAYTLSDGVVIIGLGTEDVVAALEARDSGTSLAERDEYVEAFDLAGARAGTELWVDVAALVELVGSDALDGDARDILGRIGAFAFTAPPHVDKVEFHAVLTVPETRPD